MYCKLIQSTTLIFTLLGCLKAAAPTVVVDPEIAALAEKLKDKTVKTRLKAIEDLAGKGDKAAPVADKICDATMDANGQVGLAALASLEKFDLTYTSHWWI